MGRSSLTPICAWCGEPEFGVGVWSSDCAMSTLVRLASSQRPPGGVCRSRGGRLDGDDRRAPGALDVHKAQVTACVRTQGPAGSERRISRSLRHGRGVVDAARLAGRARGDAGHDGGHWRVLEAGVGDPGGRVRAVAGQRRHVKQVPAARPTSVMPRGCASWRRPACCGRALVAQAVRTLRNLTRYRKTQIQERAREANRLHKALEDTGIKLDCVATDILGVSGRAMLDALVAGTTDPHVLAELARGKLPRRSPRCAKRWRAALTACTRSGSAGPRHIDFLDEQIAGLTEAIAEQIAPFEKAVELLCTITGVQRRTAEAIIAEIGVDMRSSRPPRNWPRGPGNAPATTSPPANGARARPAGVPSGWTGPRGGCAGRDALQGHLPGRPVRPPRPPRPQEGARCRQALDHRRLLAHAHNRRALQRPRRRPRAATPPRPPSASSPSSNDSATSSRCRRRAPHRARY